MKIETHYIGNRYIEVSVDEIKSGVVDKAEAMMLAENLIEVAGEIAFLYELEVSSKALDTAVVAIRSEAKP